MRTFYRKVCLYSLLVVLPAVPVASREQDETKEAAPSRYEDEITVTGADEPSLTRGGPARRSHRCGGHDLEQSRALCGRASRAALGPLADPGRPGRAGGARFRRRFPERRRPDGPPGFLRCQPEAGRSLCAPLGDHPVRQRRPLVRAAHVWGDVEPRRLGPAPARCADRHVGRDRQPGPDFPGAIRACGRGRTERCTSPMSRSSPEARPCSIGGWVPALSNPSGSRLPGWKRRRTARRHRLSKSCPAVP